MHMLAALLLQDESIVISMLDKQEVDTAFLLKQYLKQLNLLSLALLCLRHIKCI